MLHVYILINIIVLKHVFGDFLFLVKRNTPFAVALMTVHCSFFLEGDNFQLIVGLGVGISLYVLAVLIGPIFVYFIRGKFNPVVLPNNDYVE